MTKLENNDMLDVVKFGLALVIVSLHSKVFPTAAIPIQRLAVPLFFMISAYLFFQKEQLLTSEDESKAHVRGFVVRTARLYAFWLVALFPVTVYLRREWFADGVLVGILRFAFNIPFGSTFIASWFVPALAIGVWLVWWMGRRMPVFCQILTAVAFYGVVTAVSSYGFLRPELLGRLCVWWQPCNSFPAAVFWVWCGKRIAECPAPCGLSRCRLSLVAILSVVVLYVEWHWVGVASGQWDCDAYCLLFPAALAAFLLLLRFRPVVSCAKTLRKLSIMVYALHGTLVYLFFSILKIMGVDYLQHAVLCFFCVSVTSIAAGYLILKLEPKARCLHYAH